MATAEESSTKYLVPGLQRGLEILQAFSRDKPVHNASDLARRLDIPRSTVFRLLQTLEAMDFLLKHDDGRSYRLGPAVLSLGFEFLAGQDIIELSRPLLERLRNLSGCSVHLALREGTEVVYVAKYPSPARFTSSVQIGSRLPAHATGLGRVLLAALSDDELAQLYPEQQLLTAYTAQTPTCLSDLKTLLRRDCERGYVVSEAFFEAGICSIACPLHDASGRVTAAFNLIALEGQVTSTMLHGELLDQALSTAAELSEQLSSTGL